MKQNCPDCNGSGCFATHGCHGDEKLCQRICPIPEPCEYCGGSGFIEDGQDEEEVSKE